MQQVSNVFDDGCATLDTGCQRMAVGNALERYSQHLPTGLKIQFVAEKHQFRSVHQTSVEWQLFQVAWDNVVRF